jgi:exodeoxyribonuclease VII small subunit
MYQRDIMLHIGQSYIQEFSTMKKTPPKNTIGKFEASVAELERLLEEMESGDISLEATLKAFEEGVKLTRSAQKSLEEAEQTVRLLVDQDGDPSQEKFDATENE